MKTIQQQAESRKRIQLLFLIAAGIVIYPAIFVDGFFSGYGSYGLRQYIIVPCLLFFGSAMTQPLSVQAKRCLLLSGTMILWFAIVQIHHWLTGMSSRSFGMFAVSYLLAFPYATVTEDGKKNTGLNWIGGCYMAYSLVMAAMAAMLLLNMVPQVLSDSVKWLGTRASLIAHPNGGSCMMMLGIGFSMYFLFRSNRTWIKWMIGILTLAQFTAMILTNSRTTIFVTCVFFGGILFFILWDGSWKRFLAGVVAALAVAIGLFSLSGAVFEYHTQTQVNRLVAQGKTEGNENQQLQIDEETGEYVIAGVTGSQQGDLSQDMKSLNGRTYIWKAAFSTLQDNPGIMLRGTEYAAAELSYRNPFPVNDAHNSWLQLFLILGAPAFSLAIIYTILAVKNIWILLWRKQEDLSKKVVALLTACLLVVAIMEVYLFTGDLLFTNFIFFLCTGYLIHWNTCAAKKE